MAKKRNSSKKRDPIAEFVVKELGGPTATARLVGIKPPSVMGWLEKGIPKPWLKYFDTAYPEIMRNARNVKENGISERIAASDDVQAVGGTPDRKVKESRATL